MAELEKISIREYGRRKGCSDTNVRKAIAAGYIVEGLDRSDPKRPKIIPSIADAEWSQYTNPNQERITRTGKRNVFQAPNEYVVPDDVPGRPQNKSATNVSGDATRAAAQKAQAVYKAKLLELEYKEKLGELVNKQAVYNALFAVGQELRSALQSIPDRIIDNILASRTRNEAHLLLVNAIADALEKISDLGNNDILNKN